MTRRREKRDLMATATAIGDIKTDTTTLMRLYYAMHRQLEALPPGPASHDRREELKRAVGAIDHVRERIGEVEGACRDVIEQLTAEIEGREPVY